MGTEETLQNAGMELGKNNPLSEKAKTGSLAEKEQALLNEEMRVSWGIRLRRTCPTIGSDLLEPYARSCFNQVHGLHSRALLLLDDSSSLTDCFFGYMRYKFDELTA